MAVRGVSHCGSDLHSLMISDGKHLFMSLLTTCVYICIYIYFFGEMSVLNPLPSF